VDEKVKEGTQGIKVRIHTKTENEAQASLKRAADFSPSFCLILVFVTEHKE
jgi:hypothetical protein